MLRRWLALCAARPADARRKNRKQRAPQIIKLPQTQNKTQTQNVRRYSRDRPRLGDTLDVIKFVCKDFWTALFKKQVDNLKTNHRVCVLCLCLVCVVLCCVRVCSKIVHL